MNTLNLRIRYRPLRIGWCVRNDNMDDLRKALRLTHTLWGDRYNPVIPIDDLKFAKQLINFFRVDALYPTSDDIQIRNFIDKFTYLPWPSIYKEIFTDSESGKSATLLDVFHTIYRIYEDHVKNIPDPRISFTIFEWDNNDPLSDMALAMLGGFPSNDEIGVDYSSLIEKYLPTKRFVMNPDQPLPCDFFMSFNISNLTSYKLLSRFVHVRSYDKSGFYIGNAQDFADLINFWNLRAADIDLIFYDHNHDIRFNPLRDEYLNLLRSEPQDQIEIRNPIAIWSKSRKTSIDLSSFGSGLIPSVVDLYTWNGLNVKPTLIHFKEQFVLGTVTDDAEIPSISFQLPEKPFLDDFEFHKHHLVVSVHPLVDITKSDEVTFLPPYIPELNEYYGREGYFIWNAARAEVDGLGIVINVIQNDLRLRALKCRTLIEKIFEAFGMSAKPSQAGLIASRLIQQMGGLQGCRVFKIAGVRKLIEKYNPFQSFTRSAAVQIIGQNDANTGQPNFSEYENLYIEYRHGGKLKPTDAFTYLVKKGVFRVGLKFNCPNCQLEFWLSLDDVRTLVKCEYCGNEFNVTPQLQDRDWAYRRSGLFGREDHQEGGIPVALTLQQINTMLVLRSMIYGTAININPVTAQIDPCETDLVVITQGFEKRVQLLIGECKTRSYRPGRSKYEESFRCFS